LSALWRLSPNNKVSKPDSSFQRAKPLDKGGNNIVKKKSDYVASTVLYELSWKAEKFKKYTAISSTENSSRLAFRSGVGSAALLGRIFLHLGIRSTSS